MKEDNEYSLEEDHPGLLESTNEVSIRKSNYSLQNQELKRKKKRITFNRMEYHE